MYKIILSSNAKKFYLSSDDKLVQHLNIAFDNLANEPNFGPNIKKLKGKLSGMFRYRVGNYRIVYSIENQIKIVSIVWIGKRKDAYKN